MPIQVAANLIPRNSAKWPVLEDVYIRGGIRVVASAAARDAIYADAAARPGLKIGMLLVTADDQRLWQYTGVNAWTEFKRAVTKTYTFSIPGTVWNIPHNVGTKNFTYTLFDETGLQIFPNECKAVDANTIQLTFLEAVSGAVTINFNV